MTPKRDLGPLLAYCAWQHSSMQPHSTQNLKIENGELKNEMKYE